MIAPSTAFALALTLAAGCTRAPVASQASRETTMVSRDRQLIQATFTQATDDHLADWSSEDRAALASDLYDSLVAPLHPAAPNPDVSSIDAILTDFGTAPDTALRAAWAVWREQEAGKVHLFMHLGAVAPSVKLMMTKLGEAPTEASVGALAGLLARAAQPTKVVRLLPLLFALHGSADGVTLVPWFTTEFCRQEASGLLEFSEAEVLYRADPIAYLNLGDTMSLSAGKARALADMVHGANNSTVLRNRPPNEPGLAALAAAVAKRDGKQQLSDSDLEAFMALIQQHNFDVRAALAAIAL